MTKKDSWAVDPQNIDAPGTGLAFTLGLKSIQTALLPWLFKSKLIWVVEFSAALRRDEPTFFNGQAGSLDSVIKGGFGHHAHLKWLKDTQVEVTERTCLSDFSFVEWLFEFRKKSILRELLYEWQKKSSLRKIFSYIEG